MISTHREKVMVGVAHVAAVVSSKKINTITL
jgi:hypothetical protein